VGFLEHVQEFVMNASPFAVRILQMYQPSWSLRLLATKLANSGKKGDIGKEHSKGIQGTSDLRSGYILSRMCQEIAATRWDRRISEKEAGEVG
jgi:hypothetical protein